MATFRGMYCISLGLLMSSRQSSGGDTTSTRSEISSARPDRYSAARTVTATSSSSVNGAAMFTRKEVLSALPRCTTGNVVAKGPERNSKRKYI
ncbi:hypothetical protein EYF80_060712 [Liparis tanakae]|uniref:Secreted protein n=1 Tax=Liparis tanakae TaxID=230148 RepID=A0A4Z2ELA1_9TELE|nr:hypothetical protein EYF80_060712 [Liparis tanakae]